MTEIYAPRPSSQNGPYSPPSYFLPPTPPPPSTPTKTPRRPSISVAMSWLSHKSSSSNGSINTSSMGRFASSGRISEPQQLRSLDEIASTQPRRRTAARTLGMGAEIVTTPNVALQFPLPPPRRTLPPIPASPPIELRPSKSNPQFHSSTPPPSGPLPSIPAGQPLRSTLKGSPLMQQIAPPMTPVATPPPLPNVPLVDSIPEVSSHPPFEPVLISPSSPFIPKRVAPSQVLITLETETSTIRTSLSTLISRPSHLSEYLEAFIEKETEDDGSEEPSPFTKAFTDHLLSEGVDAPQPTVTRLHIFLDRPSAPYAQVVAYLRTPISCKVALPRAVQINPHSSSPPSGSKLETLLELRDEAAYLGLEELEGLCEEEIRSWFALRRTPASHSRGGSSASSNLRPQKRERAQSHSHSQPILPAQRDSDVVSSESALINRWPAEFGMRSSLDVSVDSHNQTQFPTHSSPRAMPHNCSTPPPTTVGLGLRVRARSNSSTSRTDVSSGMRPSIQATTRGVVRNSAAPQLAGGSAWI